jgi:UDP-N-acetylmuramate dehydrogenase
MCRLRWMSVGQSTPFAVKLPDPSELGNAGSFFRNSLVSAAVAQRLRFKHADLVAILNWWMGRQTGQVRSWLPVGWERAGWKGFREVTLACIAYRH